ncbi:GNAT family N-acetyltransferase [Chryseobacterium sp. RRHN12]|uniref:GNAT family N-acetyltransferase n=1 Tax=Chryseobacterium sp. RRHN12 TaxID=3437884 RepID=UPI003D9AC32D
MTDKSLQSLIDNLNSGNTRSNIIFRRSLSQYVDFAKIWLEKPTANDNVTSSDGPDHFYLIKNNEGVFVATVYDMLRDLHWFVLPEYRGKGYLTQSLKSTIIPHLFLSRDQQRITIDEMQIGPMNFIASQKVALNLGFIKKEEDDYILLNDHSTNENLNVGENSELTAERMSELRKQINFLARSLWTIQSEIEMGYGKTEYSEDLEKLVRQIKNHTWKIEDFWWNNKREIE